MCRLLPLLTLLAGCSVGDPIPLPGQAEAVALIWTGVYGETREPPPIYWRRDICGAPNGNYPPLPWCSFYTPQGIHVAGAQYDSPWHLEIGAPYGDGGRISNTSLAHELLHASIGDGDHLRPEWGDLLDEASAQLVAHGL
jgi:hypothetical protein